MAEDNPDIIPEHESGVQTNTESSSEFDTVLEAKQFYEIVRLRLLNPNGWHELAGTATAKFYLTDKNGNEINRFPFNGDHLKIDAPVPGSITGEGFDWVRIEAVDDKEDLTAIKVRPATNPTNERTDIAHFFDEEATSSFVVKREGKKVIAAVYGRNEKPNTSSEAFLDKARNAAVASGAITGFSKIQWKSLVNGLLKKKL